MLYTRILFRTLFDIVDIASALEEILQRVKDLSTQSNDRHWKINGITDELKCLQNDFVSLSQRVAYLKSANSKITSDVGACQDHATDTTDSLGELHTCLEQLQETLDTIEGFVHPCGGSGWRQIVDFDASNPATLCSELNLLEIPTSTGVRTCGRSTNMVNSCDSVTLDIPDDEPYNQVCGKVIGYQLGSTTAFAPFVLGIASNIEDAFVEGFVLTRGVAGSREHIWTFAAGFTKQATHVTITDSFFCPCVRGEDDFESNVGSLPSFLNGAYFCESGRDSIGDSPNPPPNSDIEITDPLWDGLGCADDSECCEICDQPYFHKTLETSTDDDIEARLCFASAGTNFNIGIERVEIYVR